jgi:ubiquinone/menaquinone biosynthesis C-methylase UbiE
MAEVTILHQIEKIRDYERGYRASHVLNTGFRFGLLNALAEAVEGLSSPELAVKVMLYEPYLKIWCRTAYHFEILDCDHQGRFKLQPFMEEVLGLDLYAQSSPAKAAFASVKGQESMGSDPLDQYIRTGRISPSCQTPDASFATRRATKSMITIFLSMIFPARGELKKQLSDGVELLDIGCGSANLLIDFAHAFKRSRFVGIDSDVHGIEIAEGEIEEFGLTDRVHVENVNAEDMHFDEEFDVVSMVLTLHEILPESRPAALSKAHRALKKDGRIMILDYPYPGRLEDFRNPRYEYGIMEQYFEAINGIVHISQQEQDELLLQAGFKDIERMPVSEGGMLDFITAVKS